MKGKWLITLLFVSVLSLGWSLAWAQDVIIKPLGTHTGQFCSRDRALLFEDPNGTKVLYDAGRSVLGATDPRLPVQLDIVLLTSVHSDHLGDARPSVLNNGTCADPTTDVDTTPNSNTAEIVAGFPNSQLIVGGEMREFMRTHVAAAGGVNAQVQVLRHGGERTIGGVAINVVAAHHSNGAGPEFFLGVDLLATFAPDNLTAYTGPENGYILTFSNGLVVYLSGDTGPTSDMKHIVSDFYGAKVAVLHIGSPFSMTPAAAAFASNKLIKPRTLIVEHANSASSPGNLAANVQALVDAVRRSDVIVPFSFDHTTGDFAISCDRKGKCTQHLP